MNTLPALIYNDGGRKAAGYKGEARDCAVRAIAIATGKPYREVYTGLFLTAKTWPGRGRRARAIIKSPSPRTGVFVEVVSDYLESIGWRESKVHVRLNDVLNMSIKHPAVLSIRKHITAMVDGGVHDTWDCRMTSGRFAPAEPVLVTRIWTQG